mgnify:FL=1
MNGGVVTWRPAAGACAHATLRALGGGRCALCEPQAIAAPPQPEAPARPALTPEQAAELRRKASAERMRRSLALFVRRSWHVLEPDTPLEWSWHHDALCAHLQAMVEDWEKKRLDPLGFVQRIRNLIINLPPGTAKSRLVMVHFVAWCWLRNPGMKILCISSNPENVNRDAELCRDLVSSLWYRVTFAIGWKIREDIDAKKKYKLTTGGERVSRALLAKFTGIRADMILADDLDDAHDVFGEADRKKRASKWSKSIYNRVNDKRVSIRIGVQQRVHEDDWTGQLLAEGGTWAHLSIPMTYDAAQQCACVSCTRGKDGDDRVGTPIGWRDPRGAPGYDGSPIMHPDRFPLEDLADERKRLGDYVYDCQYEQRPGSLDGGMFKRAKARFYRIEGEDPACLVEGTRVRPKGCDETRPARVLTRGPKGVLLVDGKPFDAIALSVDASHGSLSEKASRSSLTVFGVLGADLYVLHDSTKLRSFTDTLDDTVAMRVAWKCTHVLIEAKANGRPVIEVLEGKIPGLISIETGSASKESRASAMLPSWDAGQVWILEGAEWLDEWVTELCVFPRGKHDDRVDSLAQAGAHFRGNAIPLSKWSQYGKASKQMQVRPW